MEGQKQKSNAVVIKYKFKNPICKKFQDKKKQVNAQDAEQHKPIGVPPMVY